MRKTIAYILALLFTVAGIVVAVGGTRAGLAQSNRDDILAALFIGGMFVVIGAVLAVATHRAYRRGTGMGGKIDADTFLGVGLAHGLAMDDSADDSDFGDDDVID